MSNLNIEFQQMFLLINRTTGASVLIPSKNHQATLSGPLIDGGSVTLQQADVRVRRDGKDLSEGATLRPGARFLPYLDYVFHAEVEPLPDTKSAIVPDNLNARVILAGGYLTELPAANAKIADVVWTFIRPDGQKTLTQCLTDRLLFTLPLDEDASYEIVIRQNGAEQRIAIPAEGANFTLVNQDIKGKRALTDTGEERLEEYAILYGLTTASTLITLYPIPTANIGIGGGGETMCGGGQGDGGDDPPPGVPPLR